MGCSGSPAESAPAMRWWGWGREDHPPMLSAQTLADLRRRLGVQAPPQPPVAFEQVRLPQSRLQAGAVAELEQLVGEQAVRTDRRARVQHAAGRGYLDLLRLRCGEPEDAPDAVVSPAGHEQVLALLGLCCKRSIAVVPFGGGTSVVGGVTPLRGSHEAVVALDLAAISKVQELDRVSRIVTVGAGMRAAALERWLAPQGLTLGHFPQSFEHVSLGGCAATRSAGQASTGYGRFEQMVLGLRLAAPAGPLVLPALPATAAGPDLRALIVGSEGVLGVIDRLTLRLAAAPRARHYEGLMFPDFEAGVSALRTLAQEDGEISVARLSDSEETTLTLSLASGGVKQRAGRLYIGARGYDRGCLAILGFEGEPERVEMSRRRLRALARTHRAIALGRGAGESWVASRFEAPYMRDELITHRVIVETLETATKWSNLGALKAAVGEAISGALASCGTPGIVGAHVSHLYPSGASLYFTFLARALRGEEQRQWHEVKDAACEAILRCGGTITHHHAIGRDHAAWLPREIGASGVDALSALKRQLDPNGIMNPGKLLPAAE